MVFEHAILFLFISISSGLNIEGNYFDKYLSFPSNNAPFLPPPPPHPFPTFSAGSPNDWDAFKHLYSTEIFNKEKSPFQQFMEMKSEFQQFMNMKQAGLLSGGFPSFHQAPAPSPYPSVPILNTYLGDQWKPVNFSPVKSPPAMAPPVMRPPGFEQPKKSPVYVQMFEIPKSMLERMQNSTKIETSALPEIFGAKSVSPVLPLDKLPGKNEENNKNENKVFMERIITKPEYSTVQVVLDLPK